MRSLGRRLEALEHSAEEALMGHASSLEVACAEARKRMTAEEVSEMEDLFANATKGGEDPTPEKDPRYYELWERVLSRVSTGWAEETRTFRDLLRRELDRLRDEWEEAGRQTCSTWQSDPEYWMVANAAINRSHALWRGAEVITDAEEVAETLAAIRAPGISFEEMLRLVGWR